MTARPPTSRRADAAPFPGGAGPWRAAAGAAGAMPPSRKGGGSELESLGRLSEVVCDTVAFAGLGAPTSSTVSSRVMLGILRNPVAMSRFESAIENSLTYGQDQLQAGGQAGSRMTHSLDKAMVNVGAQFAGEVSGRVSVEVDPNLAGDARALVAKVDNFLALFEEMGVSKDQLLFKIPGTWSGLEAVRALEGRGVSTLVTLVYSFAQCKAAAQAGASVVQLYVGRVRDWHATHPNFPKGGGPREDSGLVSSVDPGLLLIERCYNFCHKHHPKTKVMAAGVRSKDDALALAGCDFIVLSPKIMERLAGTATADGYNDGLQAAASGLELQAALSEDGAAAAEFSGGDLAAASSEDAFLADMGDCGRDLLAAGLKMYQADTDALLPYFTHLAVGHGGGGSGD